MSENTTASILGRLRRELVAEGFSTPTAAEMCQQTLARLVDQGNAVCVQEDEDMVVIRASDLTDIIKRVCGEMQEQHLAFERLTARA